jgi:DNA-directed RNA polymerase specialized sigma24 family protein
MILEPAGPSWDNFAATQQQLTLSRRVDYRYWGLEDALTESLDNSSTNPESQRKFSTLRDNRARKHRKRQQNLKVISAYLSCSTPANQHHHVDCHDELSRSVPLLDMIEQKIFGLLASDKSYIDVASRLHLSVGQVKSKVYRARKRLKRIVYSSI